MGEEGDKSTTLSPGSEHQVFRFTFPDSASETFIHHNSVNVKFASHSFLAVVKMGMWSRAGWESVLGFEGVVDVWLGVLVEKTLRIFSPSTGRRKGRKIWDPN